MDEQQTKTFTASWDLAELQEWEAKIDRKFRYLKPYYKGKLRTVKQRNKARWINRIAKRHNNSVRRHREAKRLEGVLFQITANEIRKEIDKEILDSIVKMLDPTLHNIEMERQQ